MSASDPQTPHNFNPQTVGRNPEGSNKAAQTLHHAATVCDGCQTVAAGFVTASGRIVSVDAPTTRAARQLAGECFAVHGVLPSTSTTVKVVGTDGSDS